VGGIPDRTTICATIQPEGSAGAPVAPTDINNAIQSCPAGDVVKLAAGSFYLNSPIALADFSYPDSVDNVTLRGAGADQTKIYLYGTSSIEIGGAGNGSQYSTGDNWIGGYAQGATQLTLTGNAPSVGSVLFLTQCDTGWSGTNCNIGSTVDNGSTWICGMGSAFCTHSTSGGDAGGRSQVQAVVVKSVSGSGPYTVTISPGLYMNNWNASSSPEATWIYPEAVGVGLEDVSIDFSNATSTARPISMGGCSSCWIKGIRVVGAASDTANTIISIDGSTNYSIVNNYIAPNGAGGYPIDSGNAYGYSDGLIMNNITPGLGSDTGGEGNVEAYNYMRSSVIMAADPLNVAEVFFHHTGGTAYNLMEGNEAPRFTADNIHGTHDFPTLFRNWFSDEVPPYSQAQYSGGAIELGEGTRFANVIGNVLGTPGYTTDYEVTPFTAKTNLGHVYQLGLGAALGSQGVMYDALVKNTLFRWGNYDVVNSSTLWNASDVPSSLDAAVGYQQQIGTGNGVSTTFSGTLSHVPCIVGNNAVYDPIDNLYSFDNGTGTLVNDVSAGSVNCSTGAVTVTFTSAPTSSAPIYVNYVQQTTSTSPYQNPLPSSHVLPNSLFLTAKTSPDGGTGLSWWKVCTNYPTCSTSHTPPFPAIGPDVTGGSGPGGLAYNIPAAVAWATLPIDTSYQKSYTVTGATSTQQTGTYCTESGLSSPCYKVTLSVSGLPSLAPVGAFEVGGMPSGYACPTTTGECQLTGSNSTAGTVTYALSSSPSSYTSGGTFLYPDIRQFNEAVYEADSVNASSSAPTPTISSFSASPATITLGSSSVLSWNVSNASSVLISGNNLTFSTTTASGITSITPNATGTLIYTLSAASGNGTTTATTSVNVAAAPTISTSTAPRSLLATSGDTSVLLSWQAPASDGGSSLTEYLIDQRFTGSSTFQQVATTSPSVTTNTISSLTNGTSYDFEVFAVNGVGTSSASNIVSSTPTLTYYVDSSGSNSNVGTTSTAPFATLAKLVLVSQAVSSSAPVTSTLNIAFIANAIIEPATSTTIFVPASTTMTAPTTTDFTALQATTTVAVSGLPSGYSAVGILMFGLPSSSLVLSSPITITMPVSSPDGTSLTVLSEEPGSVSWTSLTTCTVSNGACAFTASNLSSFAAVTYTAPSSGGGGGFVSSGGGGGGGGGGYFPPVTTSSTASSTPASSSTLPTVTSLPTSTAGLESLLASLTNELTTLLRQAAQEGITITSSSSSYAFTRDLTLGDTGPDVQALQTYLNAQGFLVASTGPGSPGHETDYFGPETQAALAAFQKAHGINPPEGYFGPITRSFIAGGTASGMPSPAVAPQAPTTNVVPFTQSLGMGSTGTEVSLLQKLLAENPEIYPQGYVTGYFGIDTHMAVQLFQHLYGIAQPSGGYGVVDQATRTILNQLYDTGKRP
jgi:peptidoglycan hydrolase-like protein with peptidoglycan-binding domain